MSIKQEAEKFLKSCRIIDDDARVEGIIVTFNFDGDIKIVKVTCEENEWNEESIDEISIIDIVDEDDDKIVVNFKEIMFELIGENDKYMIEKCIYRFLIHDDFLDDEEDDFDFEAAEERARCEADEEEEAERNFERYLKRIEEI